MVETRLKNRNLKKTNAIPIIEPKRAKRKRKETKEPEEENGKDSSEPNDDGNDNGEQVIITKSKKLHPETLPCTWRYDGEICYVKRMIENVLKNAEASSLIVCGDAGIGKTTLIDTCLGSFPVLRGEIANSSSSLNYGHLKVALFKLDGVIHGKDDLATIRLIGRRLKHFLDQQQQQLRDNDLDEDSESEATNALQISDRVTNSIPKIMSQLRTLTENNPNFRAIIVLDKFEVFCRRQQALLYNLLDLAQHGKSLLVIGITRRLDYLELLEKRVRSRLTQRIVHLIWPFKNFDSFRQFCSQKIDTLCRDNPTLKANFDANKDALEKELTKAFAIHRNFDEVNRIILEYSFYLPPEELKPLNIDSEVCEEPKSKPETVRIEDPKILALSQLKKNDLIFLLIVIRNLRDQDLKIFTCAQLYQWSAGVSLLRKTRIGLVIKSIYNLIESDLVIHEAECCKRKAAKHGIGVNKWTKLVPNIGEHHLEKFINDYENRLPQSIKRLF